MKIGVLSDLHGNLIDNIEPCEIVLICGDIVPLKMQRNFPQCEKWLKTQFSKWINNLPCENVFMVAGNHDLIFENQPKDWIYETLYKPTQYKLVYLENNYVDYISIESCRSYRIYGTPLCHKFGNWAFMYEDNTIYRILTNSIPKDCDIVISHDAPYGTSDICYEATWHTLDEHIGSRPLKEVLLEKQPKYFFHGHLHTSNHEEEILENTKVYNTSILNEQYEISFKPLYLDI